MSQIADLTREFVLASGVITGYQTAAFRDDAQSPFNNSSNKILLSMTSSLGADDLIASDSITLYLITKQNPTSAQVKACSDDAEAVKRLFLASKDGYNGKIFNFTVISGVDGPYFDSQGRKGYGIVVQASSNSLC